MPQRPQNIDVVIHVEPDLVRAARALLLVLGYRSPEVMHPPVETLESGVLALGDTHMPCVEVVHVDTE
jgi:hypothetical protein